MFRRHLTYQNAAVASLPMQAFVAPANFDPDAQEVNIVRVYAAYLAQNVNARYIFSVDASQASTSLIGGTSYQYGETVSGSDNQYDTTASTITWTSGSTKRWVVVNNTATSLRCILPQGSSWAYAGNASFTGIYSFSNYLKAIHLYGNVLLSVEDMAFDYNTSLSGNITIPDSVNYIGANAFSNCTNISGNLKLPHNENFTTLKRDCFYNCKITGTVEVPASVTIIEDGGYYGLMGCFGNTSISSIVIKGNVTTLGAGICCGSTCSSVTLPVGLLKIGDNAFRSCSNLKNIVIPASVTSLGSAVFYSTNINDMYIYANIAPSIADIYTIQSVLRLHIPILNSGYNIDPWSNTSFISQIIADL